jgi:hypothetical protein
VTLSAVYSLRARAGLFSCRRRSWDSPFGAFSSRKVSTRFREDEPTRRFSRRYSRRRSAWAAQRAAASGLSPFRESLATAAGLVRQSPDTPLGFALSGSADWSLARAFTRAPPARFRESTSRPKPAAPRSLDQLQLGPSRTGEPVVGRTTLTGFSHRTNPAAFKPSNPSGLLGSPCAASRITADCPTLFGRPPRSTAAARALIWGAEHLATLCHRCTICSEHCSSTRSMFP